MELEHKSLRIGAAVIILAIVMRLLGGGLLGSAAQLLGLPEVASVLLFFETGRIVRVPQQSTVPPETTPDEPAPTAPSVPEDDRSQAVFAPADAALVELYNNSGYSVDIAQLLQQPLSWDLTGDGPTVLILHTHATESYVNTENYKESSGYRTLDEHYNMVSVGDRLAARLEAGGIRVLHDRTLHDYPSYSGAYNLSRETVQAYLKKFPSIRLVLDLHRDAIADSSGKQIGYTLQTSAGAAAKMMLVMGSNAGGLTHPNWQDNLSLAVKLQAQLEKANPGICRPISLRTSRYNQDLCTGTLLVEMGAAGNTRQEALVAADLLAAAVLSLAHGSTGNSTN